MIIFGLLLHIVPIYVMRINIFKGTHTISKKSHNSSDNPEALILRLKPWKCKRWYKTPNLSGGALFSSTCACVYLQEMCPFHLHL